MLFSGCGFCNDPFPVETGHAHTRDIPVDLLPECGWYNYTSQLKLDMRLPKSGPTGHVSDLLKEWLLLIHTVQLWLHFTVITKVNYPISIVIPFSACLPSVMGARDELVADSFKFSSAFLCSLTGTRSSGTQDLWTHRAVKKKTQTLHQVSESDEVAETFPL